MRKLTHSMSPLGLVRAESRSLRALALDTRVDPLEDTSPETPSSEPARRRPPSGMWACEEPRPPSDFEIDDDPADLAAALAFCREAPRGAL